MMRRRITGDSLNDAPPKAVTSPLGLTSFLLAVCVVCAAGASAERRLYAQGREGSPLLTFSLKAENYLLCFGAALTVSLELRNVSNSSLAIDPTYLWGRQSFSAIPALDAVQVRAKFVEGHHMPGFYQPSYVVLGPGETFRQTRGMELQDDFFRQPGKYTMSLSYVHFHETSAAGVPAFQGSVESNEIEFEVAACGSAIRTNPPAPSTAAARTATNATRRRALTVAGAKTPTTRRKPAPASRPSMSKTASSRVLNPRNR